MKPKIRFKDFGKDWEESIVFDKCKITTGKSNTQDHVENGLYPFYIRSERVVRSNKYLYDCEAVITIGDGNIGRVFHYVNGKFDLHQRCYMMKDFKDVDALYFYYFFSTFFYERAIRMSAKATVDSVRLDMIAEMSLHYPINKKEQKDLTKYFCSLDSLISAFTCRLAYLKQIKAASLQSMFPQEGETTPRIRFKGFEGEWKKTSFRDITSPAGIKNKENFPLESYSISNEFGFIPQNEQFENGGTMASADKRMYYVVSPNSFAYNPARINVGSLGYYSGNKNVIVSSLYEVFKTNNSIDDYFLLYWFKTNAFQRMIEQYQEGGVRLYFFYDKLCKCIIKVPLKEEQQKIADYFKTLDRQITLQTRRLEKLKQIKAACLNKMFV